MVPGVIIVGRPICQGVATVWR